MNLLITVGHDSSVIALTNDGEIIAGYEEERFTRKKAEGKFPIDSLKEILKNYSVNPNEENTIYRSDYVDHTIAESTIMKPSDLLPQDPLKYERAMLFVRDLIKEPHCLDSIIYGNFKIKENKFRHHDRHAEGIKAFADMVTDDYHILIADGSGDNNEVVTLYDSDLNVIFKDIGRNKSYGMLYIDACNYCGMIESQDENKFLGYESKIETLLDEETIKAFRVDSFFIIRDDLYINGFKTRGLQKVIFKCYDNILSLPYLNHIEIDEFSKRVLIGFAIQNYTESCLTSLVEHYKIKNLIVGGGVFYNVKLNNKLLKTIPGKYSANPIAGDQGNAIGLYNGYGNSFDYGDLCWGKRNLRPDNNMNETDYFSDTNLFIDMIVNALVHDEIVNVITGNMEFAPRALCNTSTLALPTKANVDEINNINNRDTVMPMAPVLLERNMSYFFYKNQYSRVINSDKFMIITYDYKKGIPISKYGGVMHRYPTEDKYSGRPQVIYERTHWIYYVLDIIEKRTGLKALINTSFNIHGKTICRSLEDAHSDYMEQRSRASKEIHLFIGDLNE